MSIIGNDRPSQGGKGPQRKRPVRMNFSFSWFYIILIFGIIWMFFNQGGANPQKIEWDDVKEQIKAGDVKEIVFIRNDFEGRVTIKPDRLAKYADKFGGIVPKKSPHFIFLVSSSFNPEETFEELNSTLPQSDKFKVVVENDSKFWSTLLEWLLFPLLLILMWVFMFRGVNRGVNGGGGPGGIFNVGKSTGKLAEKDNIKVSFKDVAGLEGAKEEVMEIVDFLKNPKKYTALGGKIPKGALLVGPPGTGKTLLAKAVAGEANVPFFSISGSDFVEMFVGVGASRVRDLFRQAKEKAPCIVFIDEIDAVGRARGKNVGFSSNDERENTLNQLLTEMDGFDSNSGVIILAATNRADILDKALLRAGRFDRQIHVDLPDLKERIDIFKVHLRNLKLEPDFDVEFVAKHTPGFSGADIANVCNEAALTAARRNKKVIDRQDFLDAVDRIIGGLERKTMIITPEEKKSIAHHEAGHATVSWFLKYANPLFKVTIVPRGQALGAAWYLPEERKLETREQMIDEMCALLGGRVAEEIVNGQPSTGALNDLERLTKTAYAMVTYYGMSEKVGTVSFYDSTGARGYDLTKPYSEKTAETIDQEVKDLIRFIHDRTYKILVDHKEGFEQLAALLLEKEVIFADDLKDIFGPRPWGESEENIFEDPESENAAGKDDSAAAASEGEAAGKADEDTDTADEK
ncbi:MAG: ATP-dependent zinc metalloprotease FtsH [Bacteroidetes bacterium]|uniref:ATP-dependent zinc metalloprotease FtsH n=1 Tax=Candidatus Cryptobacteroides faecavium TaxID=2840762 RepID=A0A9D9NF09_9BACT|nr:ATP-dependent zinc metalloprotease FtsH [Candidatus Cryptobacteroides faecavium]